MFSNSDFSKSSRSLKKLSINIQSTGMRAPYLYQRYKGVPSRFLMPYFFPQSGTIILSQIACTLLSVFVRPNVSDRRLMVWPSVYSFFLGSAFNVITIQRRGSGFFNGLDKGICPNGISVISLTKLIVFISDCWSKPYNAQILKSARIPGLVYWL